MSQRTQSLPGFYLPEPSLRRSGFLVRCVFPAWSLQNRSLRPPPSEMKVVAHILDNSPAKNYTLREIKAPPAFPCTIPSGTRSTRFHRLMPDKPPGHKSEQKAKTRQHREHQPGRLPGSASGWSTRRSDRHLHRTTGQGQYRHPLGRCRPCRSPSLRRPWRPSESRCRPYTGRSRRKSRRCKRIHPPASGRSSGRCRNLSATPGSRGRSGCPGQRNHPPVLGRGPRTQGGRHPFVQPRS